MVDKEDKSTYISASDDYAVKLASAYEEITGKKASFLSCKGATYAKCFENRGVAFGPVDETDSSLGGGLHSIDEFIKIDALVTLAKIYALAVCKLTA